MSDPVYAGKYAEGAERGDILGKLKQAIDARHVDGMSGWFVSGGTLYRPKSDNTFGGVDVGFERYPRSWLSHRASIAGIWSDDERYLAVDTGLRTQLPTRLTPFVGAGALLGASSKDELADQDGLDNDNDKRIDEKGETESDIDRVLVAIYPETGVHFWFNGSWRATAFGRFMVTSLGRDNDDWLMGGQLTYFPRRKSK